MANKIRTRSDRFETLGSGRCSTRGWRKGIEWTRGVRAFYARGGKYRVAIDQLLDAHARRLPSTLECGREVSTQLDNESLFPDNIYLMTACGTNGSWDPPRNGKVELHTLIGFPSSF